MKNSFLTLIIGFLGLNLTFSQPNITINIPNNQDSLLLIARYLGEKVILVDTAKLEVAGTYVWRSDSLHEQGIYMPVNQKKNKLFEFILGADQDFVISSDTGFRIEQIHFEGSEENRVFYEYMMRNKLINDSIQVLREAGKPMEELNEELKTYRDSLIDAHPAYMVSLVLASTRTVDIPEFPNSGSEQQKLRYNYYLNHFWDHIRLNDPRLVNTPLLPGKSDEYFDKVVRQYPDTVISYLDRLINKCMDTPKTRDFLLWHFNSKYQGHEIMGMDRVFVHLVDTYFSKLEIENNTPEVQQALMERADQLRKTLIGVEAPNLILMDTAGNFQSFLSLKNDYLLLYFWDFDCSFCKKEMKVLMPFYNDNPYDLEIFAINTNADLEKWKKYILEHDMDWVHVNGTRSITPDFHDLYDISGTPVLFLLDKERKIIAKKFSAGQLGLILENMASVPE